MGNVIPDFAKFEPNIFVFQQLKLLESIQDINK